MTKYDLFFAYADSNGDVELWDYNGASLDELTPDVSAENTGLYPSFLDAFGDELIFQGASSSDVKEMWVSNGKKGGAHVVKRIKGANPGGLDPSYFKTYKNMVLFDGASGFEGAPVYGLWVTKGTAGSTVELGGSGNRKIKNVDSQGLLAYVPTSNGFTIFDGLAFFAGYDKAGNIGLWRTNGTVNGTYEIEPIKGAFKDSPPGTKGSDIQPAYLCVVGKKMFFAGEDLQDGQEGLWVTTGTAKGTYEVGGQADKGVKNSPVKKGINPEVGMGPVDITAYKGEAIFAATDNTIGPNGSYTDTEGLWISNGAAGGTIEIGGRGSSEITGAQKAVVNHGYQPGGLMSNAFGGGNPDFTVFDKKVLFLGVDDKSNAGQEELWVTNGTVGGTHEIGGIHNAGIKGHPIFDTASDSNSPDFTIYDGKVFFTALVAATNEWAIWTTNGAAAGTHMVAGTESYDYPSTFFTVGKL